MLFSLFPGANGSLQYYKYSIIVPKNKYFTQRLIAIQISVIQLLCFDQFCVKP